MDDLRTPFERDGYCVIRGVLPDAAIHELRHLLDPLLSTEALAGTDATDSGTIPHLEQDHLVRRCPALRRSVAYLRCHEIAQQLVGRHAAYVYDHAIYKPAKGGGGTPWHQDEAYGSNGGEWASAHFWIPLQDVNDLSGCLRFIPRSHLRGPIAHSSHSGSTSRFVRDIDESQAQICALRSGDISVHHPRTLHAASGNKSDGVRRAWIVHFGPFGRLGKLHPNALAMRLRQPKVL